MRDLWHAGDKISVDDADDTGLSFFDETRRITRYFKQSTSDIPHWYRPDFCGDVAVELVERAYRTTQYIFFPSNLHLLDRFLATDVYGLNVVPANFVRDIPIAVYNE